MADFYELLDIINKTWPDIFTLLSKPGVAKVAFDMADAEQKGQPWTTAQIDSAMQATDYYRNTSAKNRSWDILQATDPDTARTKIENTKNVLDDMMQQLGINLSNDGGLNSLAFKFLNDAVTQDWTPDQIKYKLLASVNKTTTGGGDLGDAASKVKGVMDDYGVPMSDQAIMGWASKLTQGAVDENAIVGYAQQNAMSLFPGLKDAISRGITVRQYADPYLQIANQELGTDPKTVSLTDPKWMRALTNIDPKTGQRVSMSLNDWTSTIRSDPTYGYDKTTQATTQAASFAKNLAQMMGATG